MTPEVTIPWFRVDLGPTDVARIEEAIADRRVTMGKLAGEMERRVGELLGAPEVVLVNSGTSALVVALAACGVGPGDEVVVPGLSFIATANAPRFLGATVRLVDVLPDRPLLDPAQLDFVVNERTRAILPVHLNGRAAPMDPILALARERGIAVVEDAAQAFASRDGAGRALGTIGDAGCFSFGITKLVTTGEGGAVVCRDPELATRCRRLRNNGSLALAENRFDELGLNFRPVDLLAALGLSRLDVVDRAIEALGRVYRLYRERLAGLSGLRLIEVDVDAGELPIWIEALCPERDRVIAALAARGIQARPAHPSLGDSRHLGQSDAHLPNARRFAREGLVLPSGPDQPVEDLERVVAALAEIPS